MRKLMIGMALAVMALPALAHDFWIQPARFAVAVGAQVPVVLFVGHGVDRGPWDASIRKIVGVDSFGPDGRVNRQGQIAQGGRGRFSFRMPGTYVVALATNHSASVLPSLRFNDYLEEEGLTPARQWREQAGRTRTEGREIYSRRAKTLIRVGPAAAANRAAATVTRRVGLTLEIVPERNPYTAPMNQPLPFRIFYHGRPLPGALVKLTNLGADEKPVATARSNAAGRVAFNVPRRGSWLVNVVWTRPISGNPEAQFDTTFSSLTFGFDPPVN